MAGLVGVMVFTCSSAVPPPACQSPLANPQHEEILSRARSAAGFRLLYPCYLPGAQYLSAGSVTGLPGRQQAELVFAGPFDLTIRQSQVPPPASPDPTGASRTMVNLFPNVPAIFIQRNDGSARAMYHLFWQRDGIYYELQAFGPAQQQPTILQIARSLE